MNDSPLASTEWAGFVAAMRFAPLDDTPRLVAADWLQDTGVLELEAWAEFVRFQVEGARAKATRTHLYTDSCDCGACRPERRAAILFDRWAMHWGRHAFGHVTPTRSLGKAGDFDRGFIRCVTVTLKDWKVADVPGDVAPLYERTPLPNLLVILDNLRNGWALRVTLEARNSSGFLAVAATIEPTPALARTKPYRASRITGRRNDFARAVKGAVRQAVAHRNDCFPPSLAGTAP
jgi:uncharacterized protein (TIGR02996 family)